MPEEGRTSHNEVLIRDTNPTHRGRREMKTKLIRIQQMSMQNKSMVFTSLFHMINKELLMECHHNLDGNKAIGIDNISKETYEQNLETNLEQLVNRLKNHSYRPKPALRIYIPKANGKKRPLNISCYEDKLVQYALKCVLEAVYEPLLLDNMYGFRPQKGCHNALKDVTYAIEKHPMAMVLDADIKGFFDNLNHEWIVKMVKVHITDPNVIWLLKKILKAGYIERECYFPSTKGIGQGSLCSPIVANIYMHYAMNLWFHKIVKRQLKGYANLTIYADDFVGCFQYISDARYFHELLKNRLATFTLELEPTKTRLIRFGRFAKENAKSQGKRQDTFNFLGFTHYCGTSRRGEFRVKRKTDAKKFRNKVREIKDWLRQHRNTKLRELIPALNSKLAGHYHYFGITDNFPSIQKFYIIVHDLLYKWLNRRSQKRSYNYVQYEEMLKAFPLAKPRIYINIYEIA